MSKKHWLIGFLVVLSTLSAWAESEAFRGEAEAKPKQASKPHLRFAFIGCNRIGFTELTPDNPSTANRQQFLQTCADLSKNPPAYLFWVGDIVTNYAAGSETLREQLTAWLEFHRSTEFSKSTTVMVPIVGNHEVLTSDQDPATKKWIDRPNPETLPVWENILAPYLLWNDGPKATGANPDELTHDQSSFSFTVRDKDVLFICLNTDTFIDDKTIGDVPLHWIEDKLEKAEKDPSIRHVFLLGHKPVVRPDLPGDMIRDGECEEMDRLMGSYSKVRAFLTSHFHLWDYRRTRSGVPQVIAGNGGSLTSGDFNLDGKGYYGFTMVQLFANGDLNVENWGRPVPVPYDSNEPQPPAKLLETISIPAKTQPGSYGWFW